MDCERWYRWVGIARNEAGIELGKLDQVFGFPFGHINITNPDEVFDKLAVEKAEEYLRQLQDIYPRCHYEVAIWKLQKGQATVF